MRLRGIRVVGGCGEGGVDLQRVSTADYAVIAAE